MNHIEVLNRMSELFKELTYNETLFSNTLWMSHVLHANGFIRDAIEEYNKDPNKERSKFLYGDE